MYWKSAIILLCSVLSVTSANVNPRILELNDRFLEIKLDGNWLVMFYAPWCAHCRRLEPVWSHVQQSLHNTNIRVCKMDCVLHKNTCYKLKIRNYPTIMFIKGEEAQFTYNGDRQTEDVVHFALRVASSPIRFIEDENSISHLKEEGHIFFLYIGECNTELWDAYSTSAVQFQPYSYFYHVTPQLTNNEFEKPAVVVYKENSFYQFRSEEWRGDLNKSLDRWVNEERFPTFVKITRLNINMLLETNKYLVMAVVQESKIKEVPPHMMENMVESIIKNNRERFQRTFQFGWIGNPDLANSIAMSKVPLPCLLVLNSTTNHHHIPDDEPLQLTPEAITIFLESILNQSAKTYGGNSIFVNLYRLYFEILTSLAEMWKGNPVLTSVIFGLPLGFLALICYSICCSDILDADDEDIDDDSGHEKNE